ncbi:MAG: NAD(P)-dependent oxidoreductase [Chloroflexota bacterium]
MTTAAVIGVGAMGSAFVERFHQAGLQTVVYDVSQTAVDRAVALGSRAASSSAEAAKLADIVDVMVLNDEQVLEAVLGAGGVLEGMEAGKVLLLHSTIHPRTTLKVAETTAKRDIELADACITGRPPIVRAGNATCILGAPDRLVERITPHLRHLAKHVLHMGPLGRGNASKIVKNMITGSERLVIAEGLRIAEATGVPYTKILELLQTAWHESVVEHWRDVFDPSGASPAPVPSDVLFGKDIPLAEELAGDYHVDVPIVRELAAAGRRLQAGQATP